MNRKTWWVAAAALLAGAAWAGGGDYGGQEQKESSAPQGMEGGPAQAGNEITGEVVKVEETAVFVRDDSGEVLELTLDENTSFEGEEFTRDSLQEGTQVRASFTLEGDGNYVATSIAQEEGIEQPGTGGTGEETMPEQPAEEPGTGEPMDPEQGMEEEGGP